MNINYITSTYNLILSLPSNTIEQIDSCIAQSTSFIDDIKDSIKIFNEQDSILRNIQNIQTPDAKTTANKTNIVTKLNTYLHQITIKLNKCKEQEQKHKEQKLKEQKPKESQKRIEPPKPKEQKFIPPPENKSRVIRIDPQTAASICMLSSLMIGLLIVQDKSRLNTDLKTIITNDVVRNVTKNMTGDEGLSYSDMRNKLINKDSKQFINIPFLNNVTHIKLPDSNLVDFGDGMVENKLYDMNERVPGNNTATDSNIKYICEQLKKILKNDITNLLNNLSINHVMSFTIGGTSCSFTNLGDRFMFVDTHGHSASGTGGSKGFIITEDTIANLVNNQSVNVWIDDVCLKLVGQRAPNTYYSYDIYKYTSPQNGGYMQYTSHQNGGYMQYIINKKNYNMLCI